MQDQPSEVQPGPHGAFVFLPSTGLSPAAEGGGAARPASALNLKQERKGNGLARYSGNIDSIADAMKPPQPIGLAKICFVGPEITSTQYWRLVRAIAALKDEA